MSGISMHQVELTQTENGFATPVAPYHSGLCATLAFSWVTPLLTLGARRPLQPSDVAPTPEISTTRHTFEQLSHFWNEEKARSLDPSLIKALMRAFRGQLALASFTFFFFMIITFIQPLLVSKLLEYVDTGTVGMWGVDSEAAIYVALLLGGMSAISAIVYNNGFYYMQSFGLMVRTAMIAIIFEKSLKMSNDTRLVNSSGEIMTLMSVDVERLWLAALLGNWLIMAPLMCAVTIVVLYFEVGYVSLVVAASLLLWAYFQECVSTAIGKNRRRFVAFTSQRIKVMNEILQGIRVIKLYAWEGPCVKRVCDIRNKEVEHLHAYLMMKMVNTVAQFVGPVIIAYVLFMTFSFVGKRFTIPRVYTILSILNIARVPIILFPIARTSAQEAWNSVERIRQYLLSSELPQASSIVANNVSFNMSTETVKLAERITIPSGLDYQGTEGIQLAETSQEESKNLDEQKEEGDDNIVLSIENAFFDWSESNSLVKNDEVKTENRSGRNTYEPISTSGGLASSSLSSPIDIDSCSDSSSSSSSANEEQQKLQRCILKGVSFRIKRGEKVAIVGSVGVGKSSLIMAMLGQMSLIKGKHTLKAKVAYASQEHWIQNLTVKDNILFDAPFDEVVYETVMDAAQLSKDLLTLPNADDTEIGERGINLSGGQKARVNLARALYCPGVDMYVFDDPLAAVDVHVGKALFRDAFQDLLEHSTLVIAFSSNYQFLSKFDKIIVVTKTGAVELCESYADLKAKYPQYVKADEEEEEEEEKYSTAAAADKSMNIPDGPKTISKLDSLRKNDRNTSSEHSTNASDGSLPAEQYPGQDIKNLRLAFQRKASLYHSMKEQFLIQQLSTCQINTITKEEQEVGAVRASVFTRYFAASLSDAQRFGGNGIIALLLTLFLIGQVFRVYCDLWVGIWAKDSPHHSLRFYYIVFTALAVGTIVFSCIRGLYFILQCLAASKALHNGLLVKVLNASVSQYFDVTPIGRVLNRFSKDLDSIDSMLPDFFLNLLQNGFHVLAVAVVCAISTPFFIIVLLPLALIYYYMQEQYRKTSRELRRMESVSRSPIYTLFGELLVGLSTVRAYSRQVSFFEKMLSIVDHNNKFFFTFWVCSRWLALRLDLLGAAAIFTVSMIAVLMVRFGMPVNGSLLGVAIVFALQLSVLLQWTVRTVIETENNMTSVERLLSFDSIEGEASSEEDTVQVLPNWPSTGAIEMKAVSMRYRPGLPLVLKDVNFSITGGSKVGVCGRTGSGKSSLMQCLFRIVEPESSSEIAIDGVNVLKIGLQNLRSRLTIIPQDPVMFSGSLRFNLDPFDQYSDSEVWDALDKVELKADIIAKFPDKLHYEISERGENVSVGQRQLLCIARALLRKSKVIIMDEATASVDTITDAKIQSTIRKSFKDCTVLTIAHRLETIADYDMIIVMDSGCVAEAGLPYELLQKQESYFSGLVNELGADMKASFLSLAKKRAENEEE